MVVTTSFWKTFAGHADVQPILHIPMVYENLPASAPRWEYRVVSVDVRENELPDEGALNELGAQGWMLVGALEQRRAESSARVYYYFVRQQSEV